MNGHFVIARTVTERFTLVASAVRAARKSSGLSQQQLATKCGWPRQVINKFEMGRSNEVTAETLNTLQAALAEAGVKTRVE